MCTVSFVPTRFSDFILTSNRDEGISRGLSSSPRQFKRGETEMVSPLDPLANGSWIAASEKGSLICLLNGAFKKHKHQPPYRMSRGIVVLDSALFDSSEEFAASYNLEGIEPFTMVMLRNGGVPRLHELRWDGEKKYLKGLDTGELHVWSSATLYSEEMAAEKQRTFKKYLEQSNEISPDTMIKMHRSFLYEDWVKPPARVQEVSTLSITAVQWNIKFLRMYYRDLVRKEAPLTMVKLDRLHSSL